MARSSIDIGLETRARTLIKDFTSATPFTFTNGTFTAAGSSLSPKTDVASVAKLVYTGNGSTDCSFFTTASQSLALNLTESDTIGLWWYFEPPNQASGVAEGYPQEADGSLTLRISNTAGDNTNYRYYARFAGTSTLTPGGFAPGWNYSEFYLDPDVYSNGFFSGFGNTGTNGTGAVLTSAVNGLRILFQTPAVGSIFHLDSIDIGPRCRPCVIFGTDSPAQDTVDRALPYFDAYGWKGYFEASPGASDLNVEEWIASKASVVASLTGSGWEFGSHGWDGTTDVNLQTMTPSEVESEIKTMRDALRGISSAYNPISWYIGPSEAKTTSVGDYYMAALDMRIARVSQIRWAKPTKYGLATPYRVAAFDMGNQTLQTCKDIIDGAITYGCSVWLFWHQIIAGGNGTDTTGNTLQFYENDLSSLLDYVKSKQNQIDVLSPSEWLGRVDGKRRLAASRSAASGRSAATGRTAV